MTSRIEKHPKSILVILFLLSMMTLFISTLVGPISLSDLLASEHADTLISIRVERAAMAWIIGGILGLSGVFMQALLRNPLADPYILGVSSGASLGAVLAILGGLPWLGIEISALLGAAIVTSLLFSWAWRAFSGQSHLTGLLLIGVVLAMTCHALISVLLSLAPQQELRQMIFWLMGDLGHAAWSTPRLVILLVVSLIAFKYAPLIDMLSYFSTHAQTQGLNVRQLRFALLIGSTVLTTLAVTQVGGIGFVGLVIPHMSRYFFRQRHRYIIPSSLLLGGAILCLADTLSRVLLAPTQLPVGAIMVLIGAPLFLWQLTRIGSKHD